MKGAILYKGEQGFTLLRKIFSALDNVQKNYNWLITDFEGCPRSLQVEQLLQKEYCWLTGDQLSHIVEEDDFQWIWAVLSGFEPSIPVEEILKNELPYADGYKGFWRNPISIQHPLASIEIVPWDSSLVLFISRVDGEVDRFMDVFPLSENLEIYNDRNLGDK